MWRSAGAPRLAHTGRGPSGGLPYLCRHGSPDLPASGDAALTRRAGKRRTLSAVVLQWSRAGKRDERQGLLVEEAALQRAEKECLADEEIRVRRREREAERRAERDQGYVMRFTARLRELCPNCPAGREQVIAEHACQKYSGRVERSAGAKNLDELVFAKVYRKQKTLQLSAERKDFHSNLRNRDLSAQSRQNRAN